MRNDYRDCHEVFDIRIGVNCITKRPTLSIFSLNRWWYPEPRLEGDVDDYFNVIRDMLKEYTNGKNEKMYTEQYRKRPIIRIN